MYKKSELTFKKLDRLILSFLSIILLSCGSGQETVSDSQNKKEDEKGDAPLKELVDATVKDYTDLDGCKFMLVLENGEKLNPVNLDQAYFKDGLKVRVEYEPKKVMTTCMSGKTVEILDIQKAE